MNKLMRIGLMTALATSSGFVFAAENDLLSVDMSQKKHERKVQLQLNDMGVSARHAVLPVSFCMPKTGGDSTDKALSFLGVGGEDCTKLGRWEFEIDQSLENEAASELLGRLAGKRYDTLKFEPGKLSLKTLTETLETKTDIKEFSFDTGSYAEFKSAVGEYLNNNVAPLMIDILGSAKDARYQEMHDKEKDTFLATIAKEQSVPLKFIQKLMNSAYVYAVYAETPKGNVKISFKILKFSTKVSLNLKGHLALYRFNPDTGKFDLHKEIAQNSGLVSASNRVYPTKPGNAASIIGSFNDSYKVAAKASGIAINTTLKEDDDFAIFGTIDGIEKSHFSSAIGENEDLRVDAPYRIYQYIDGEKVEMGWGKARTVASSETFSDSPADYLSDFDLIKGEGELKDQLREHPWTGVLGFADIGTKTLNIDKIGLTDAYGGGTFTAVSLGAKVDLGYMLNVQPLSEVWLEIRGGVGFGGDDIGYKGASASWTDVIVASYGLDIAYRHHISGKAMYVGGKLGYSQLSINGSGSSAFSSDIAISASSLTWGAQAGYLFSPNFEVFVNVQGDLPMSAEYEIGSASGDAEISGGVDVNVGFAMHIKSIGGLARLMK